MSFSLRTEWKDEVARRERIAESATKPPMVLARAIVEQHIRELRAKGIVRLPPNSGALVMSLEALTHDIASAILDARKAKRDHATD